MKTSKLLSFAVILAIAWLAHPVQAQKLSFGGESKAVIEGTSNIHDWNADVPDVYGEMKADKNFIKKSLPKVGDELAEVTLRFKVATIDGGKGDIMNNKIYAAFKEEEHPEIVFKSTEPAKVTAVDKENNKFKVMAKGEVSMAGVSKLVTIQLDGSKNADGKLTFKASQDINMRDFEIDPPSALFGQIVTGEKVTVVFDLVAAE